MKRSLLIAEDDVYLREILCDSLNPYLNVVAVSDGRAALEALRTAPFDVVLSDVQMPHLNGFLLIEKIRNELKLFIPIIIMSGGSNFTPKELIAAGATAIIDKPMDFPALKNLLLQLTKAVA